MLRSIRSRLVLLAVAALVPAVVAGAGMTWAFQRTQLRLEAAANLEVARAFASSFQGYLGGLLEESRILGEAIGRAGLSPDAAGSLLASAAAGRSSIDSISLLDAQGRVVASSKEALWGTSLAHRDYFREIAAGRSEVVSDLLRSSTDGVPRFVVGRALRDGGGALVGAVVTAVDPAKLDVQALTFRRSGTSGIALLDRSGRIVFRSPDGGMTWAERLPPAPDAIAAAALEGRDAAGELAGGAGEERRIAAAVPIEPLGWAVRASRAREEVLAPIRRDAIAAGHAAALFALAAVAASLAVGRQITRAVRRLEVHARVLGSGERPRGRVTGPTELVRLGAAFDEMAARLAASSAAVALHSQAFDTSPDLLVVVDRDHRFVTANRAYCEARAIRREDLPGRSIREVLTPAAYAAVAPRVDQAFRGETVQHEMSDELAGLGPRHIEVTWHPMHGPEGGVPHVAVRIRDVTERKRAADAAREADRRKDEFLAMLSHELRNPLAPIVSSLHLLRRAPPGSDPARRALAILDRQVAHVTRLVDDLLDLSRISRGKIQVKRARIDLAEVVRRTADDHRSTLAGAGLALATDLPAGPLWVDGDATRLAQVVGNLLSNAAKFTPAGGHVRTAAALDGPDVVVRVEDDGAGIAPDMLERVFEPFTQADQSLARTSGGLGLGLALVKALVELHGGSVAAASEGPGRGTTVTVRVPAQPSPAATLDEAPPRAARDVAS